MLERLARWYLRRHLIDCEIAKMAAWNEGWQVGYRVGRSHAVPLH
jgi:hypothetical protein